jgi:hypothetical protein
MYDSVRTPATVRPKRQRETLGETSVKSKQRAGGVNLRKHFGPSRRKGRRLIDMLLTVPLKTKEGDIDVAAVERYRPDYTKADAWLGDGPGISSVVKLICSRFPPRLLATGNISGVGPHRSDPAVIEKHLSGAKLPTVTHRAVDSAVTPLRAERA